MAKGNESPPKGLQSGHLLTPSALHKENDSDKTKIELSDMADLVRGEKQEVSPPLKKSSFDSKDGDGLDLSKLNATPNKFIFDIPKQDKIRGDPSEMSLAIRKLEAISDKEQDEAHAWETTPVETALVGDKGNSSEDVEVVDPAAVADDHYATAALYATDFDTIGNQGDRDPAQARCRSCLQIG